MAEAVSQLDLHDCRHKRSSRWVSNRFHASESTHTTTPDKVDFGSLETWMLPGRVSVEVHHEKWGFNGKSIDQLRWLAMVGVWQSTAGTSIAHPLNIGIHWWPIKAQPNVMQQPICVQVSPDRIRVKCHEDYIVKLTRNYLEMRLWIAPHNRFTQNDHIVLNQEKWFAKSATVIVIDLW